MTACLDGGERGGCGVVEGCDSGDLECTGGGGGPWWSPQSLEQPFASLGAAAGWSHLGIFPGRRAHAQPLNTGHALRQWVRVAVGARGTFGVEE